MIFSLFLFWFELQTSFPIQYLKMSSFYAASANPNQQQPQKKSQNPAASQKKAQNSQQDIFSKVIATNQNVKGSTFIKDDEKEEEVQEGCCKRCCSCFSLEYYKDFFKVTNKDVLRRIKMNLKFWSGGFFEPLNQEYDLYGPFWLYTTMIFVSSAVHNVLIYQSNSKNFTYDYKVIGVSLSIFYIMGLIISAVIGLFFGCLGLACKTSQIVCLYGYSMSAYVICVLLCIINMSLTTWLFLIYGACTKIAFVLKNVFQKLQVPTSKKVIVLVIVIGQAIVQMLAIKFALIVTGGTNASVFSHFSAVEAHQGLESPIQYRSHLSNY